MKTVVCIKEVNGEINPFDACALESALQIENNEIVVVSMGRQNVESLLKRLTRLEISKAVLLTDNKFAGADTLATAKTLAHYIKSEKPDLVMCGRQSVDGDTAQTGPCISALLGYNVITNILSFDKITQGSVECTTRLGSESADFPLVATIERINTLRFPSIRSKVENVEILNLKDLGLSEAECGQKGSPTKVLKTYESQLGRRKCKFVKIEEIEDIIKKTVNEDRKEIVDITENNTKLQKVYCVGKNVSQIAETIACNVEQINTDNPEQIVDIIKKNDAQVVLFEASLYGRRIAPIVQAKLNTGLCADCTRLETDGETLFMYRPTFGGSLIAKIKCESTPVLATVRTSAHENNNIILSVGLGAKNCYEKVQKIAKENNCDFTASRGLVDKIGLPYEYQVGLTGKNVSPRVYIAIGISGAVHHTCAIEKAQTVIAINSDKKARIFDYADYGVIADINEIF